MASASAVMGVLPIYWSWRTTDLLIGESTTASSSQVTSLSCISFAPKVAVQWQQLTMEITVPHSHVKLSFRAVGLLLNSHEEERLEKIIKYSLILAGQVGFLPRPFWYNKTRNSYWEVLSWFSSQDFTR